MDNFFIGQVEASFFLRNRTRFIVDGVGEQAITLVTGNRFSFKEGGTISFTIKPDACGVL